MNDGAPEDTNDLIDEFFVVDAEGSEPTVVTKDQLGQLGPNEVPRGTIRQSDLTPREALVVRRQVLAILDQQGQSATFALKEFLDETKELSENQVNLPGFEDESLAEQDTLKPEQAELQEFKTSRYSPLPAIRFDRYEASNGNRTLLKLDSREPGVYWVALFDLDNTLYEADSKHSIMLHKFAEYLKKNHGDDFEEGQGDIEALDELIEYCDQWEDQRLRISQGRKVDGQIIRYKSGILKSGNLSAAAFKGMPLSRLQELGREFVSEGMGGRFFDYTPAVIRRVKDHGILPVITTGLPDFLLPSILEKIGIAHGQGMTYKTDKEGKLTGEIEVNMGVSTEKLKYGKQLTRRDYGIAFAMGDSEGDMGLFVDGVYKDRAKEDVNGGAVMTNASADTEERLRDIFETYIDDGRVQVVPPGRGDRAVISAVEDGLRKVFEPLHDYLDAREDPAAMDELIRKLKAREEKGKKHPNLENIKRMRDALKEEDLNQEQITATLGRFYPKQVVHDVMKEYMLDTRDDGQMDRYVDEQPHLIDVRKPSKLEEYLLRIGRTREEVDSIIADSVQYNSEHGLARQIPRRRQTTPPLAMPAITDEEINQREAQIRGEEGEEDEEPEEE